MAVEGRGTKGGVSDLSVGERYYELERMIKKEEQGEYARRETEDHKDKVRYAWCVDWSMYKKVASLLPPLMWYEGND